MKPYLYIFSAVLSLSTAVVGSNKVCANTVGQTQFLKVNSHLTHEELSGITQSLTKINEETTYSNLVAAYSYKIQLRRQPQQFQSGGFFK